MLQKGVIKLSHDNVAKKKTTPRVWTHYAITRDAKGVFSLFINGELDATSTTAYPGPLTALDLGRANPKNGGTAGWLAEFRVWSAFDANCDPLTLPFTVTVWPSMVTVTPAGTATAFFPIRDILVDPAEDFADFFFFLLG